MSGLRGSCRRRRVTRLVAALVVAALLGACGGDDDGADVREIDGGSGSASGSASGSGSAPADGDASASASGEHPCEAVDVDALEALVGTPVPEGEPAVGGVNENDVQWTTTECRWQVEGTIEMEVQLVQADDFESGEVVCPELTDVVAEVSDVEGLGDSAQWEYDGATGEGKLRACTATGMVDARVEPEDVATFDEATLQEIARTLAEPTLALL